MCCRSDGKGYVIFWFSIFAVTAKDLVIYLINTLGLGSL